MEHIMEHININIKKLSKNAKVPSYESKGASGADIYASKSCVIEPNETKLVKTGIVVEIPRGYEIQIRPRSGLALKNNVTVLNTPGTIDSDYRGEIGVIMTNFGKNTFYVSEGDRIAQMVVNNVGLGLFTIKDNIEDTERGSGGFGSTGNN